MQHSEEHQIDIMDDGDGIIATALDNNTPLHTYFDGKNIGYKTLGDYGDAVCFRYNQSSERTAHRLVCYIIFNFSQTRVTADIPELGIYGAGETTLREYGYKKQNVTLNFTYMYNLMAARKNIVREGYLTKGDNLYIVDQSPGYPLIRRSDIIGKIKIVDNDLKTASPAEYVAVSSIVLTAITAFSTWLVFYKDEKNVKLLSTIFSVLFVMSVCAIVIRDVFLVMRSENVSGIMHTYYLIYLMFLACLIFFMNFVVRRYGRTVHQNDMFLAPTSFLLFFIPCYFIFSCGLYTFSFSIFALFILSSIYQLRPDRFFSGLSDKKIKDNIVSWIFLICTLALLFVFITLTTISFYSFLLIGWFVGNIYGVHLIRTGV